MKQKKIFIGIMIVCFAVVVGVGLCRNYVYPSLKEVTQRKLDEILKGDGSAKSEADMAALFMTKIQDTQLACALEEPTDHQEQFFESVRIGLEKFHYQIAEISAEDGDAKVTVRINSFHLQEIVQNAQKVFLDEQKENDLPSTEASVDQLYEIIANEFQKGPSDSSKTEVTVFLHKKNHKWETDDAFVDEIFGAILSQ